MYEDLLDNLRCNKNGNPVDIADIYIDINLSEEEKLNTYLNQVKNPYHFKNGNIEIMINYSETDKTLKDLITKHFSDKK